MPGQPDAQLGVLDHMSNLTRRSLLLGTIGALPGLAACTANASSNQSSPSSASSAPRPSAVRPSTVHASTRAPSRADWVAFAKQLTGPVFLPGTTQYVSAKQLFNPAYDGSSPAAVAQVASVGDVQKAVDFARRFGLRVTARSGGHSYVGASAANGTLVLDCRHLAGISYAAGTQLATVGAGANLYAVHRSLATHGRTIPTGTCPTVGVAGLTLGGGLGVESRSMGLTSDRLVGAHVVLADGTAAQVSATAHPDVFWALRGGGGGAVAFVTDLQFRTHATGSKGICRLTFPADAAAAVTASWARWMAGADRDWWTNLHLDAGGGRVTPSVVGVTTAGQERRLASSLIAAVGHQPTKSDYQQLDYMSTVRFLGGGTTSTRRTFAAGTDVLRGMTATSANAIAGAVADFARRGGNGSAILDPLDGAVSSPAGSATAFPWRDHALSVQWYAEPATAASRTFVAGGHRALRAASAGGYVNYLETGARASRYFAGNTARLTQVRRQHDPAGLFHCGVVF